MRLFEKINKEFRAVKVMRTLGTPTSPEMWVSFFKTGGMIDPIGKAEQELYDLVCESRDTASVMEKYNISRADLAELYTGLILAGGGQWARNTWVAAGALIDAKALDFVISKTRFKSESVDRDLWISVVSHLIEIYERS